MNSVLILVIQLLDIITFVVVISVVMSWLVAFNVVNLRNPIARQVYDAIDSLVDPMLRPIRKQLPNMGGIDVSPVVLILLLQLAQNLIREYGFSI